MSTSPVNLLGLERDALVSFVHSMGEKSFRARQIMQWMYGRRVLDLDAMTDLSKASRAKLAAGATFALPRIALDRTASDGTRKWLFELDDGNRIETVFIPERDRGTLCVSSQVGCALDCSFCATGRQGFNRNLSSAEIVGQLWLADALLEPSGQRVTNVVMMGMGEPLANLGALVPALRLMLDDAGFGLSKRRVTVSTAGMVPAMDRLNAMVDVSLAVSLHAPNDRLRDELVPINRKWPIAELMGACRRYVDGGRKKHVLFEYVMLDDVNDRPAHARELVSLLRDFPAKVNLIPFNPFRGSGYRTSPPAAVARFSQTLADQGVRTLVRGTRGDDIDAACGQLAGEIEDRSRRHLRFVEPRYGEQHR